ncbi:HIRAN domain-containing protein [Acidovorax sp. SUPP3334]|uniref:HIRAN domain-containing protein n=1 Tax=Acidovorax sp. SUPP3334 TaxID=2920881 RepID=UPI0023DE647C|nr:HIRAN domain-containing protein [Acidovorax sp. SUPP3334]GKT26824.1 HIRAN domain-containing protein [Acidovorax sp. SUPP3334]
MNRLYVAAQNSLSREWAPVAELRETAAGYELRFTKGATRIPGFAGLGRMQSLDEVYHSTQLFPFFSNRLFSKSRPEYKDYLRWLGLETAPSSPFEVLSITGGARATDSFELVSLPQPVEGKIAWKFFPRGLRYLPPATLDLIFKQSPGASVALMKDIQNPKDHQAVAIRSTYPETVLMGYVPRYFCSGLCRLLDSNPAAVKVTLQQINADAPWDLKVLLSVEAPVPLDFDMTADAPDFEILTSENAQ